jgi:hypothetical protein
MRNAADAEQIAIGWWPGDHKRHRAAFFALAYPPRDGFSEAELEPGAAHWDAEVGGFVLDWEDIRSGADPRGMALEFGHSAFQHACAYANGTRSSPPAQRAPRRRFAEPR